MSHLDNLRRFCPALFTLALLSCGPSKEELMVAELQEELQSANASIDSLNYTVDSSNLLIDELRARADSLQHVDDKLLDSVQRLNKEVRQWRQLYTKQKRKNEELKTEVSRLQREKRADQEAIGRLRTEADSLNSLLLDTYTSIRRQTDQIQRMQSQLVQAQDDVAQMQKNQASVHVLVGGESFLKEGGYLHTSHSLFRKHSKLVKKLDLQDPRIRLVALGETLVIEGKFDALVDRYGKLKEGRDYERKKGKGRVAITFTNEMLGGIDVLAVLKK